MNNQSKELTTKKKYQTPVLKAFGKVGDITRTNNFSMGSIDDGGGATMYTS